MGRILFSTAQTLSPQVSAVADAIHAQFPLPFANKVRKTSNDTKSFVLRTEGHYDKIILTGVQGAPYRAATPDDILNSTI